MSTLLILWLSAARIVFGQSGVVILQDIGQFAADGTERIYAGDSLLSGLGHSVRPEDHVVRTAYLNEAEGFRVRVAISKHDEGSMVAHEFEKLLRLGPASGFSPLGGFVGSGSERRFEQVTHDNPTVTGGLVNWLSNSTIVELSYSLRPGNRPSVVPTDVIEAYLQLYPSTVSSTIETDAHRVEWIREEMSRYLVYARRDYEQVASGSGLFSRPSEGLSIIEQRSLVPFVAVREQHFGVGSVRDFEDRLLRAKLVQFADPDNPPTQLNEPEYSAWFGSLITELEAWWAEHSQDPVILPTVANAEETPTPLGP